MPAEKTPGSYIELDHSSLDDGEYAARFQKEMRRLYNELELYEKESGSTKGKAVLTAKIRLPRGDREIVSMPWLESDDWKAWSGVLGKGMVHRNLLKFLASQEHNLEDASVLIPLRTLKLSSQVDLDSDVQDSGDRIGIVFRTNGGESLAQFKKSIPIRIPVLDQDASNDDAWIQALIKLDVELPSKSDEQPLFTLTCSTWRQRRLFRIQAETAHIGEQLGSAWTVVMGEHSTRERAIGAER
jgi:hypothetical protein